MDNESPSRVESDLLEKVRASNTTIRTRITTVRLVKAGATDIEIKPRGVGTDTQGWAVGEAEIPCNTLEEGIIIGLEMQARG
jgi:hypothetical protein